MLHKEQCPPHCTGRRRGSERWHDSPLWSPRTNSEAGSRTPAFSVTIQGSFQSTICKRGQLLQRCPFVPFTSRSLTGNEGDLCGARTIQEYTQSHCSEVVFALLLMHFYSSYKNGIKTTASFKSWRKYRTLTELIPGKFKRYPRTGTLLIKPTTTGKNPLWERHQKSVLVFIM